MTTLIRLQLLYKLGGFFLVQVQILDAPKGFLGAMPFVGFDGLWCLAFFYELGEVGSGGPAVYGAIGFDGQFDVIAEAFF